MRNVLFYNCIIRCGGVATIVVIWDLMSHSTDVMCTGVWEVLKELQDPVLKSLAASLQTTVFAGRAPTTTGKYIYAFLRWKRWAESQDEIVVFPVRETHFALYLQHLGDTTRSKSAVQEAVNSISWVHQLAGYPAVSESCFVRMVLDGLQRQFAKPKVRKEPVTTDMMSALIDSLGAAPSLSGVRLVAACLLAFSAFLRYDELAKLRCCDVNFAQKHMSIHIVSSKTDQYRQGDSIMVARTGSRTCPVAMLERYYAMAALPNQSRLRVFRGIVVTRSGERLRSQGSLSYTRLRELFLSKLSQLGFDSKQFGLHSLRSGGASAAANAGVPDRLFKRHGRWRSESAKDGYIKDSVSALMSVSESLNL